jgi:hypothetical protein
MSGKLFILRPFKAHLTTTVSFAPQLSVLVTEKRVADLLFFSQADTATGLLEAL